MAGLIPMRPGSRTRLCHRLRYSPGLNPVEWVWAHVKRSLANLAVVALDRLEALVRNGSNAFSTDPALSTAS